ncbi:MAG TPA: crosslink repair DNA glycosylase YcaQ family protein [Geminicoccaceae bacterium]|nr:crosslink repair DNA glycosylase YcaQ family protein [Geminicoccaceae bacterium]
MEPAVRRPEALSAAAARRIALAAQGFGRPRPATPPDVAQLRRLAERLGLIQIDSVSVLVRSHYLPLFSRFGPYRRELLDELAYAGRRRRLFEYWGHEASLIPVVSQPLLRWRMARAAAGQGIYGGLARFAAERREFVAAVLAQVRDRGPLTAAQLDGAVPGAGGWWGWSDGKLALEFLFWAGEVTTAARRGFERLYDVPERVLPRAVLAAPTPSPADAQRTLLRQASRALGVATARDLRDYFRLEAADVPARLAELAEAGELLPVVVNGWAQPAYLDRDARLPRRVEAQALLSPFDSLVWERARTERLFGFRYRLEIYTPAHKRAHGYYVLPFLLGDRLVARVDLKTDRQSGCLRVLAAHGEPGVDERAVADPLHDELRLMAGWLGLERIAVGERGDLARALLARSTGSPWGAAAMG